VHPFLHFKHYNKAFDFEQDADLQVYMTCGYLHGEVDNVQQLEVILLTQQK
jgi:hypothetical protein